MKSSRWMDVAAFALLLAALVFFAGFHLMPAFDVEPGWHIWKAVINLLAYPDQLLDNIETTVLVTALVTSSLLLPVSPWIVPILKRSRPLWWVVVILSAASCIGISGFLVMMDSRTDDLNWNFGGRCLFLAPLCHLVGMLFIRGEQAPAPGDVAAE